MGALKEKITGFASIGTDTLKAPEMKVFIANAFARAIESQQRVALNALDTSIGEVAIMEGDEPGVPGEVIPLDNDQTFTTFRLC